MSNNVKTLRSIFLVVATVASRASSAEAQTPSAAGWRWSLNGNIFAGLNYQHRRFDDLRTVESQNWFMGQGERPLGRGQLSDSHDVLARALHPEEARIAAGLPDRRNLQQCAADQLPAPPRSFYQAERLLRAAGWQLDADHFCEVQSARPRSVHRHSCIAHRRWKIRSRPLAHHHLDSVHITPGVLTLGLSRSGIGVEGSWFHGREPDERRTDIDFGALDSWSVRGTWSRGPWSSQLSGATGQRA